MKYILFFIFFTITCATEAQHKVYQNFELENIDKKKIKDLLQNYVNKEKNAADVFSKFDIKEYNSIDIAKESLSLGGSLYDIVYDINILSIKKEGENYIVNAMLYWFNDSSSNSDTKQTITVLGIVDFWLIKEQGEWKISNYINYYTKNWSTIQVENIEYIYNPEHPFDINKANIAAKFYDNLFKVFKIENKEKIKYFIAKNCYDLYRMCGFSYFMSEGSENNICAFYDEKNNIIYSNTIYGEAHYHEIIHTINKHFKNSNSLIRIGLSSYINDASSRNLPLIFHFEKFKTYIDKKHLDFENFENFENIDEVTNISYVTGSLICNAIYRKGGLNLLMEYMNSTKEINELKEKLKKDFKIKSFESFFRNEIEIYKKQGKSLFYI